MFDVIEMPLSWPVDVNYHEAKAYCVWKGPDFRLPTEAEHHAMRGPQVRHDRRRCCCCCCCLFVCLFVLCSFLEFVACLLLLPLLVLQVKVIFAVVKQAKQLQRKPRKEF